VAVRGGGAELGGEQRTPVPAKGHTEGEEGEDEAVMDESILAFALETPALEEVTGPRDCPGLQGLFTGPAPGEQPGPASPRSYAGVVRTSHKTVETDPIVKIRNLGTVGSHML
jgi:hypothetical protein